jgi:O-acetyl-ADP-ribose deacetylase (regulator of RNase III)
LFRYEDGSKVYNEGTKLLEFNKVYQNKYDLLFNKIHKISYLKKENKSIELAPNLKFIKGNIFNTKAQSIVNTVNCVGVMGKGIALVFKLRYPKMFDLYSEYCKNKRIGIGKLWLHKEEENAPWVLNFPTKFHWKYPSKMEYVEKGLSKFVETYKDNGIASVAFPLLGTHNGGLDKQEVLSVMNKYLGQCDIPIEIYEYNSLAPDDLFEMFKKKWNLIPPEDRKSATGIRTQKQVDTISEAVNSESVQSMIALIEYKGIGLVTMEKCFKLVMNRNN